MFFDIPSRLLRIPPRIKLLLVLLLLLLLPATKTVNHVGNKCLGMSSLFIVKIFNRIVLIEQTIIVMLMIILYYFVICCTP